jgi:cell division septation protein DedD
MSIARPLAVASPVAAVAVLTLLLLAGCARDGQDWRSAQDADTQEAYDAFLAKYPQSEFAPKAKARAAQLLEERDWAVATQSDTPEAYQKFVAAHADGKWTQEARIRIENFNVMAASAPELPAAPVAAAAPKPAATPAPARAAPAAAPSARSGTAASAPSSAGAHRIQLGAFSSVEKAEAEWARLRDRFAPLGSLEPRITPAQTAAGRLFRLQAGLPDADAARRLCDTLKAGGQACLYVPPK